MNTTSNPCSVMMTVAALKAAYLEGSLKNHPVQAAVAAEGNEVLASWGSAMRR